MIFHLCNLSLPTVFFFRKHTLIEINDIGVAHGQQKERTFLIQEAPKWMEAGRKTLKLWVFACAFFFFFFSSFSEHEDNASAATAEGVGTDGFFQWIRHHFTLRQIKNP